MSSRVYERVDSRLGMTPSEYRAGGEKISISYVCIETPLGLMTIAATDRGLCSLQFGDSRERLLANLRAEFPAAAIEQAKEPYSEQLEFGSTLFRGICGRAVAVGCSDRRARHGVPGQGVELSSVDSLRRDANLFRNRPFARQAGSCPSGRQRLRIEPGSHCYSMPPRDSRRWKPGRLSLGA